MVRPYYADYIKHCMKYFSKTFTPGAGTPAFKTEVDRRNWFSCYSIYSRCTAEEKKILLSVYGADDTLADNIYTTARDMGINQDKIWNLVGDFERKVAKRRGLL